MKNKKITRNISQGMYVLTVDGAGCMVDAVSQVSSGDEPLISIAVNKNNYTNGVIRDKGRLALSVLPVDVSFDVIELFGMNSSRDINKFDNDWFVMIDGLNIYKESIGYMILDVVDIIDTESHDLFIGRMVDGDKFNDKKEMTYGYYQEHKDELVKVRSEKGKSAWVCSVCGYVYYGDELPDGFKCPICGVGKEEFKRK